ncbi:hypothetical protein TorRG33x02_105440, partial [Trema orientale]
ARFGPGLARISPPTSPSGPTGRAQFLKSRSGPFSFLSPFWAGRAGLVHLFCHLYLYGVKQGQAIDPWFHFR